MSQIEVKTPKNSIFADDDQSNSRSSLSKEDDIKTFSLNDGSPISKKKKKHNFHGKFLPQKTI